MQRPELVSTETVRDTPTGTARAFAVACAQIASDNKTEDVVVLDLRGLSTLTDYFVIGTGRSDRQMHAVMDLIREHARSLGRRPLGVSGSDNSSWILADYIDVVVHLFDEQHRAYYDLDALWGDAPRLNWAEEAGTQPPDEPNVPPVSDAVT